jgi:hypothetical protein
VSSELDEARQLVIDIMRVILTNTVTDCNGLTILEAVKQEVEELKCRYAKLKPSVN